MSLIYNIGIGLYDCGISIASLWNTKARLLREGRRDTLSRMATQIAHGQRIAWVHAASLGEFEQGRPIIERLKATNPDIKILLTFFSPSGYEIRKNFSGADYIYYLPSDRPKNVKRFLDIVNPTFAIFIKYEFWLNYLEELRRRDIATYLVSAIFRPRSIFFQPWGGAWRRALSGYKRIFVQNISSAQLLRGIGIENTLVAGDTRFDRVAAIARDAKPIPIIERFKGQNRLFVAGSTWEQDEKLLIRLVNDNPDIRFIIAPHEMDESRIDRLLTVVKGGAIRYSSATENSDLSSVQVLILDTIGILSSAYGYAHWAYIGGGFGRGIHNTLEAATFGLPLAFGPNYHKFQEARELIALGAAQSIANATELEQWFSTLKDDRNLYVDLSNKARNYTAKNCGATELIVRTIMSE